VHATTRTRSVNATVPVDEAQAFLGLARSEVQGGGELDVLLIQLERDLWILMSELVTAVENRHKLVADQTLVTSTMIERLEIVDAFSERFDPPTEFVVPGETSTAAPETPERQTISAAPEGLLAVAYLNRLSGLLWTLARRQEQLTAIEKLDPPTLGFEPHRASAHLDRLDRFEIVDGFVTLFVGDEAVLGQSFRQQRRCASLDPVGKGGGDGGVENVTEPDAFTA
jgi:cob(I)alamin adenosyltransferase